MIKNLAPNDNVSVHTVIWISGTKFLPPPHLFCNITATES